MFIHFFWRLKQSKHIYFTMIPWLSLLLHISSIIKNNKSVSYDTCILIEHLSHWGKRATQPSQHLESSRRSIYSWKVPNTWIRHLKIHWCLPPDSHDATYHAEDVYKSKTETSEQRLVKHPIPGDRYSPRTIARIHEHSSLYTRIKVLRTPKMYKQNLFVVLALHIF